MIQSPWRELETIVGALCFREVIASRMSNGCVVVVVGVVPVLVLPRRTGAGGRRSMRSGVPLVGRVFLSGDAGGGW